MNPPNKIFPQISFPSSLSLLPPRSTLTKSACQGLPEPAIAIPGGFALNDANAGAQDFFDLGGEAANALEAIGGFGHAFQGVSSSSSCRFELRHQKRVSFWEEGGYGNIWILVRIGYSRRSEILKHIAMGSTCVPLSRHLLLTQSLLLFLIILNNFEVNNWWLLRLMLVHASSIGLGTCPKMSLEISIALAVILAAIEVLEVDLAAGTWNLLVLVNRIVFAFP